MAIKGVKYMRKTRIAVSKGQRQMAGTEYLQEQGYVRYRKRRDTNC